jgi:hypothetical protein
MTPMTTSTYTLRLFLFACILMRPAMALADTLLEFQVKEPRAASSHPQSVVISQGQILAKGAGGEAWVDLVFNRATDQVQVIDHRQRTVMVVDEGQVDRLGQQAKTVQPLMQGIGEQIAKLSPEERMKWQALVGENFSLEAIATAATPPAPTRMLASGWAKAAGIRCQAMRVMQGATPMAEICVAEADALAMPADDFATLRALLGLYERIAPKAQRLATQFGLIFPIVTLGQVTGIPIVLRDLSRAAPTARKAAGGETNGSLTLRRIKLVPVSPQQMSVPAGYASKPLRFW